LQGYVNSSTKEEEMQRPKRTRTPLGALLALALGALALLALPSLAAAKDRNHDRIPDRWERRHHLSLEVKQGGRDQDRDQLDNIGEFRAGDNPGDRDTDDDGVMDGEENAGTIASFDAATGKLTITLFGGDTVSGLVTEGTKIKCEDEHAPDLSDRHGGHDEDEPGDDNDQGNSGAGSENSGPSGHDDNGTGANCTTSDLLVGAVVREAELEIEHGQATFEEVELAG
jgi:hypothetical protein